MVSGEGEHSCRVRLSSEYLARAYNRIRLTGESMRSVLHYLYHLSPNPRHHGTERDTICLGERRKWTQDFVLDLTNKPFFVKASTGWLHVSLTSMPMTQPSARWQHIASGTYGKFRFWQAPLAWSGHQQQKVQSELSSHLVKHNEKWYRKALPWASDPSQHCTCHNKSQAFGTDMAAGGFLECHTCYDMRFFPSKSSCEDWSDTYFFKCSDPHVCPQDQVQGKKHGATKKTQ